VSWAHWNCTCYKSELRLNSPHTEREQIRQARRVKVSATPPSYSTYRERSTASCAFVGLRWLPSTAWAWPTR